MLLADREPKIAARVPMSISVPLVLKKMAKPLATALVDACNHEHFIEQAIVSVFELGPSAQEMKVIVTDGGSTDNTSAMCANSPLPAGRPRPFSRNMVFGSVRVATGAVSLAGPAFRLAFVLDC